MTFRPQAKCSQLLVPVLLIVLISGCAPKAYDDPIGKMLDTEDSANYRLLAAEQAERESPDDPKRIEALKRLLIDRGHPTELRTFAADALIRHDEADAKAFLRTALPRMNNWPAMRHIIETAVERRWVDFTPALVRSYARPAHAYTDAERPEAPALTALNPGRSIEDIAFAVMTADSVADIRERAAAWQLLNRLTEDRSALMARLAAVDVPDDPLIVDLKAAATDLHVTADSLETVAWLQMLRSPLYAGFWNRAKAAVATLTDQQKRGLELRHLGLIVQLHETDDEALRLSRDQLYDNVSRFLSTQKHYLKSANFDGHNENHPQRLHEWAEQLTWADLLVMDRITKLMRDRAVIDAWFIQADEDLADKSTEYGGLMAWNGDGRLMPDLYKPMIRRHDRKYYAPKSLTLNGYAAFAHYHFHAQSDNNDDYAGPGRGDLERIADTQRYTGLVLTFVGPDVMNVDYYRQDGVVVDMGTVRR